MERALRRRRRVIEVRRLSVGDLAAFRELHRLGLRESPRAFVETLEENATQSDLEVESMLARDEGWGAFLDGKLVTKLSIDTLPYGILSHTRWIHGLYAAPEARGPLRAAEQVLRAAIRDAQTRGVTRILLWVSGDNARARAFYERLGFAEVGRVPGGLLLDGQAIDDVLMCLAA